MDEVRKQAKREARLMDKSISGFMNLFADKALNTSTAPSLAQYTPTYAPYSQGYAEKKNKIAPDRGWFSFTGKLEDDIRGLSSQTTNLLGHSSTWLQLRNNGLNQGFSLNSAGQLVNSKNRFAAFRDGFKDFEVTVNHRPFNKLRNGLRPKKLEKEVFFNTEREVYSKLVNTGGSRNTYRGAFYAFTSWWIDVYLRQLLKEV